MKPIRVIVLGILHDHALPVTAALLDHPERFELAAICPEDTPVQPGEAPEGTLAKFLARWPGLKVCTPEEGLALPGIEGAVIESRERDLCTYAVKALKAGLHVHMDKPGGEDPAEFYTAADLSKERGLVFSLGYMYRQNPAVIRAKELIAEGALGDIISVEAQMNCRHDASKRRWLGNMRGGEMFFLGCHLIDLIVSIQGEPKEVIPLSCATGADGVTSRDYGMAVLKYERGVSLAKSYDNEPGGFMRRQLVITGTEGTVEIRPLEGAVGEFTVNTAMRYVSREHADEWPTQIPFVSFPVYERYAPMLLDYYSYVRGEKENPFTPEYEKLVRKVLDEACR